MILLDTQRGEGATERLQKLATAKVTTEREEQPCDAQEHLQMEHQRQAQYSCLCHPPIHTSWGKTNSPGLPVSVCFGRAPSHCTDPMEQPGDVAIWTTLK